MDRSNQLSSTTNDETLRAVFDYPEAAKMHVDNLVARLENECDPVTKASIHAEIGNVERGLGNLRSAEESFLAALAIVEQHPETRKQVVVYSIRLAHVYHWQEKWDVALAMFDDLHEKTSVAEFYQWKDFVLQHRGKMFFDQRLFKEAFRDFCDALVLRQQKGDAELIASTQQALAAARKKLGSVT